LVVFIVWQRDGVLPQTRIVPVASNSVWVDVQPWEALARMEINQDGWVDRLLLEKSTAGSNRNDLIARTLRTMNFGTNGARNGRASVRFDGGGSIVARAAPPPKPAEPTR
jgi:hypothetical protein